MRQLVIMRHGKAEARAESGEDFDRALTTRGLNDAARVGEALAEAGLALDLALVSGAQRTRQTWGQLATSLPDVRASFRSELYNASADALLGAARIAHAEGVMLVAHNPGAGELALRLAVQADDRAMASRLRAGFPTSTAAVFAFADGRVTALGLFTPKGPAGG